MIDQDIDWGSEVAQDTFPSQIVILDAGAQYVDLIRKAAERHGFPAVILPIDTLIEEFPSTAKAVIVSGGPGNAHVNDAIMPDRRVWEQDEMPTLNICYGMQAFALHTGGNVSTRGARQDGRKVSQLDTTQPIFTGVRAESTALFTHGDFVDSVPENVQVIGRHETEAGRVISAIVKSNHIGLQFHPEVFDDTPQGYEIFGNFFKLVAGLEPNEQYLAQQMTRQIKDKQRQIMERVGDKHVIAFVSGGVDSVTAVSLAKDIIAPEKLHMYYIDNGYMRDEDDDVIEMLKRAGLDVQIIYAESDFEQACAIIGNIAIGPLINTVNPVSKRRIIGEEFVNVQDRIVAELGLSQNEVVLLQGTNAADRIESGNSKGGTRTEQIKEHHNQVQRVRDLNPLEPLDDLFKDEIRALAIALGLPEEIAYRQPFPGPGTAIRILGLEKGGYSEVSTESEALISDFIGLFNRQHGTEINSRLLPVRSVGVGGDSRSHIQATALEGTLDSGILAELSGQLTENFRGVTNRVVHKLAGQALSEIEPTVTQLTREVRRTLRDADGIVHKVMREMGLLRTIEQMPVVLLPMGSKGNRSIVLRPITTRTHMTVQAMLPELHLPRVFYETISRRILEDVKGISYVFLDATNKPPGTTEWE
jgi:GMP synthase (glutamine-hydrolysing)